MIDAKIGIFKACGWILIHETIKLSTQGVKLKYGI